MRSATNRVVAVHDQAIAPARRMTIRQPVGKTARWDSLGTQVDDLDESGGVIQVIVVTYPPLSARNRRLFLWEVDTCAVITTEVDTVVTTEVNVLSVPCST